MTLAPARATVFVDADNTLWDTDAVFARAQLCLLEAVEHITGSNRKLERRYFGAVARPPVLRPGVLDGLDALQEAQCLVVVITEGAVKRVRRTAADVGLTGHFDRIVEAPKQSRLYERVMRMTGAPDRAYMVGDQLDRDIAPAMQAGLVTIYFPGAFGRGGRRTRTKHARITEYPPSRRCPASS